MDRTPKSGEFYRHFKDKLYQVLTVAEHTETGETLVVYQALYGEFKTYARPLSMFTSEVDREKYPDASQKYRFEKMSVLKEPEEGKQPEKIMPEAVQPEAPQAASEEAPQATESELNSDLLFFIEAETYDRRLEYLERMREKIGQPELDIIYVTLDMNEVQGTVENQLHAVEQYLLTQKRYDGGRLR